jgi:hypothetical protein
MQPINKEEKRLSVSEQLEEVRQRLLKGGTDLYWLDDPK